MIYDTGPMRKKLAKATPGKWNHLGYAGQDGVIQGPRQAVIASLSSAWGESTETGNQCFSNAALIVAAKNDLPAMLDTIDAQATEIARLRGAATVLDQFAMAVLTGFCSQTDSTGTWSWHPEDAVRISNQIANAMMLSRIEQS